ncbi:hypothetical protein OFC47_25365 [Escherichia coli]|nr:hypothetical protein [Escherichia coli]
MIFDIKNYDRNGPEGQFTMASTTMCNAGSPPYYADFLITAQSVNHEKDEEKKRGGGGRFGRAEQVLLLNREEFGEIARVQIP